MCLGDKHLRAEPRGDSRVRSIVKNGSYLNLTSTMVFEEVGSNDVVWCRTSAGYWVSANALIKTKSPFCSGLRAFGEGVVVSIGADRSAELLEFGEVRILRGLSEFRSSGNNSWVQEDENLKLTFSDKHLYTTVTWLIGETELGELSATIERRGHLTLVQDPVIIENERLDLKYKACLRQYVEDKVNSWQQKGEFEKIADYQERVNAESIQRQITFFQEEAVNLILEDVEESFHDYMVTAEFLGKSEQIKLSRYDAENETFQIQFGPFGKVVLPVPIDIAPRFKETFDPEFFESAEFELMGGYPVLRALEYLGPQNIVAQYRASHASSFIADELDYEIEEITTGYLDETLEIQEESPALPSSLTNDQASPNGGYTDFNAIPKDIIVERVAVVPTEGMDCSGNLRSGQELASIVEGSVLGYYEVVERRNLERVLDEQKLALSGIMFEKSTVEAGCNIGAQGIIFTEFGCIGGEETIQVKLVDCQTSELYWSATGHGSSILDVVKEIKANLD